MFRVQQLRNHFICHTPSPDHYSSVEQIPCYKISPFFSYFFLYIYFLFVFHCSRWRDRWPDRRTVLEVFDATRHAWPITRTAHPFIIQAKLSDMRLGPMQRRKECDSERVRCTKGRICGGYGGRELFDDCLSFVGTGVCGRERGNRGKEIDLSCDR